MLTQNTLFFNFKESAPEKVPEKVQDKGTPPRTGAASPQAHYANNPAHQRKKHHGSQNRRVKELSGCVMPEVFDKVERMREQWAKQQGKTERLSRSEVVGTLVTRGVQGETDMQYGAMLTPVLQKEIKQGIAQYSNRTAFLAVQAYYAAEEARLLFIEVLRKQLTADDLDDLLKWVRQKARRNLTGEDEER